jgi:hypothetical protein
MALGAMGDYHGAAAEVARIDPRGSVSALTASILVLGLYLTVGVF